MLSSQGTEIPVFNVLLAGDRIDLSEIGITFLATAD